MEQFTVNDPLKSQLGSFVVPVEIVDENGRTLGHFVPTGAIDPDNDCPYGAEELRRMREETSGRPLAEIWKAMGVA